MSSLIGAKNKPIVPNFRQKRHQEYIRKRCCLLLEDIPNDTTHEEVFCLTDKFKIQVEDLFFPFNLLTQQQLPKVYIFTKDNYNSAILFCKLQNLVLYNKPVKISLFKGSINY
jgi:hypothetical protein